MSPWSLRRRARAACVPGGVGGILSLAGGCRSREGRDVAAFASVDGTKLYYEEEGTGTPVVLLHGLSSSTKGNWQEPGIWAALVDVGKRVIGLDARGHGRSDKPHDPSAYRDHAMVRDVGALLDHLGLESTDLVGYS